MSDLTDAQDVATYNAKGSALPGSIAQPSGLAAVVTVVSGTPFQVSTKRAARLYIAITTAAALTISMGPEAAGTSVAIQPSQSSALGLCTLDVPAGWYVKLTGTVTNYTVTSVLV